MGAPVARGSGGFCASPGRGARVPPERRASTAPKRYLRGGACSLVPHASVGVTRAPPSLFPLAASRHLTLSSVVRRVFHWVLGNRRNSSRSSISPSRSGGRRGTSSTFLRTPAKRPSGARACSVLGFCAFGSSGSRGFLAAVSLTLFKNLLAASWALEEAVRGPRCRSRNECSWSSRLTDRRHRGRSMQGSPGTAGQVSPAAPSPAGWARTVAPAGRR